MTTTTDAPTVPTQAPAPQTETLDIPAPPQDSVPKEKPARPSIRRGRRTTGEPKAPATPKAPRTTTRRTSSKAPKIGEGMASLYVMLGTLMGSLPGPASKLQPNMRSTFSVGSAIVANSAECGAAWEKAADEDPRIRAALERVLVASAFSQLIAAHAPIALMAGVELGVVPPEVAQLLAVASASES